MNEIESLRQRVEVLEKRTGGTNDEALMRNLELCAINVLMRTHPDPVALREAWDREIAKMWAAAAQVFSGRPKVREQMMALQAAFESMIDNRPDEI